MKILVPGVLGSLTARVEGLLENRGYTVVSLGDVSAPDLETGLSYIDNDICAPTVAIVGQYMEWFEQHEMAKGIAVLAPIICHNCRCISLQDTLGVVFERAGLQEVEIVELSSAELAELAQSESAARTSDGQLEIGICGTAPVLTVGEFRSAVCDHLGEAGIKAVLPPLKRILDRQDFLTPAMEYFNEKGVGTVICILPFGCLSGHVYGRAQLREMRRRFPDIELTILDYDPSASEINLLNRTELVIQAARERQRTNA